MLLTHFEDTEQIAVTDPKTGCFSVMCFEYFSKGDRFVQRFLKGVDFLSPVMSMNF